MSPRTTLVSILVFLVAPVREARPDPTRDELTPLAPACVADDVEVVGYRACAAYGTWSVEPEARPIFIAYGTTWRHFRDAPPSAAARDTSPPPAARAQTVDALVFVERAGVALSRATYAALELEMGNFAAALEESSHDIIVGGVAAAGLRGRIGAIGLGGELAFGYRGYSEPDADELVGEPVVEARGRVELWATPWFSIGGVAGSSLRERGAWMAGISLAFHTHAYAGDR